MIERHDHLQQMSWE